MDFPLGYFTDFLDSSNQQETDCRRRLPSPRPGQYPPVAAGVVAGRRPFGRISTMLATAEGARPRPVKVISPWRIAILMALSFGLYPPYWMYCTWRQYYRHTGHRGYPVWHGLAWLVPVYGFFRFYAQGAAYRQMLDQQNLPHSISMSGCIVSLVIAGALGSIRSVLLATTAGAPPTLAYALAGATIVMDAFVIAVLKRNINCYWQHAGDGLERDARLGKGEILVVAVGTLFWSAHIAMAGAAIG